MPDQALYRVTVPEGSAVYADMALVSIPSLRITNPSLPIRLLCGSVEPVETPAGSLVFRHRWIKTQLPCFIRGGAIHRDADTLVRGSLATLPGGDWDFAAVPDNNSEDMREHLQTLPHVLKARELGWPLELKPSFSATLQRGLVSSATLPNAFNTMVLPA